MAKSRKSKEPERAQTIEDRLEELLAVPFPGGWKSQAAAGLIFLYVVGFAVTTGHLSHYGVPSYELIRVRYLAAGVLFLIVMLPPVGAGILFWREWLSIPQAPPLQRILVGTGVSLLYSTVAWMAIFYGLSLAPEGLSGRPPLLWFAVVAAWSGISFLFAKEQFSLPLRRQSIRHLFRLIFTVWLLISFVRVFTASFYPQLDPG